MVTRLSADDEASVVKTESEAVSEGDTASTRLDSDVAKEKAKQSKVETVLVLTSILLAMFLVSLDRTIISTVCAHKKNQAAFSPLFDRQYRRSPTNSTTSPTSAGTRAPISSRRALSSSCLARSTPSFHSRSSSLSVSSSSRLPLHCVVLHPTLFLLSLAEHLQALALRESSPAWCVNCQLSAPSSVH